MNSEQSVPFKILGEQLKTIRQKMHETVSEVSGAVEIDEQELLRIELGQDRPSEDVLMLLISHFGMHDDDAARLWELAGYDQPHSHDHVHGERVDPNNGRTMLMIMAIDPRIIYSDGVNVTANSSGVVLNFMQGVGTPQTLTTARIGMSRDQAQALLSVLNDALARSTPRQLPAGQQPAPAPRPSQRRGRSTDKPQQ